MCLVVYFQNCDIPLILRVEQKYVKKLRNAIKKCLSTRTTLLIYDKWLIGRNSHYILDCSLIKNYCITGVKGYD